MKKTHKIMPGTLVVLVGIFASFWPTIQMELANSAHYTEKEKRQYEYYTPEILKKMPRISERYEFDFYNVAGPGSLVYSITFHNTLDTVRISTYLASLGYVKQNTCPVEGECWSSSDPAESITVSSVTKMNAVMVQVDRSPQF